MSDQQLNEGASRFVVRATAESHFSWVRTRLSVERTIMAYDRTALALIGFGFTIVQFFDRMDQTPGIKSARYPDAAWYLGLALILSGVMSLAVAVWVYFWTLRYLWSGEFATIAGMTKEGTKSPIIATTFVLIFIGTFAFFAVLLRWV
jgi:inner membrane protein YidH